MTRSFAPFVAGLALLSTTQALAAGQVEAGNSPRPVAGESRVVTGDAAARRFVYGNRPIHPFCTDFPADSGRWDPITLARCSNTPVVPAAGSDEWREADYPRADGPYLSAPYASYIVLASKGDRFLLGTASSGGGTGRFSRLRWVRLAGEQLSLSQDEMGGDRCVGGLFGYEVKGGAIEFQRNLTTAQIVSLSGIAIDESVMGALRGGPPHCDGSGRYRYDPAADKMQLVSVTINGRDLPDAAAADPQSCFDRLVRQSGRKNPLKPVELQRLGHAFASTCSPGPRR